MGADWLAFCHGKRTYALALHLDLSGTIIDGNIMRLNRCTVYHAMLDMIRVIA